MKHYLLSIYQPDGTPPPPEFLDPIMQKVNALMDEMKGAGAWVFGGGLFGPETATVVRATGNDVLMTDGPYIEGKEHVGGFTVVRAPDLDAALGWARKFAMIIAPLAIEVRPFQHGDGIES
ncbi:MAG TPA: YciI family protein [Vicinamibacterales bacterium]